MGKLLIVKKNPIINEEFKLLPIKKKKKKKTMNEEFKLSPMQFFFFFFCAFQLDFRQ